MNLKKLLREVVRSLVIEHSEISVAPTLRAALSGDAESWSVFLDQLEETNSNARFRLQKEGKNDLIQRLVIVHNAFPNTGVLTHSKRFEGALASQRSPVSFRVDSDLDFTDIGGDDKSQGIFALNWVGWPSHVVGFSDIRVFVIFKDPIMEFSAPDPLWNDPNVEVTKVIKTETQVIYVGDGTRELAFYDSEEPYSNGTPEWWSKDRYDLLHDIASSYEKVAKGVWNTIDNATKMPEETER